MIRYDTFVRWVLTFVVGQAGVSCGLFTFGTRKQKKRKHKQVVHPRRPSIRTLFGVENRLVTVDMWTWHQASWDRQC